MRFVSLFAGVGGFDLAFERVGMTCVGQVEIDARCREVLATHWPDIPRFEDVHEVSGNALRTADLLCGGFPCQDYSVAGKRGGLAGDRGALWWQFHRLIAECRPRWVVGENVSGLLNSNGGRDFGAIIGSLVELGYGVVWRVLDAQYFGVAQRRRRVFIVGHIGGIPRPEILAFAEGCSGDTSPRRQPGENVAPSLANCAKGGGGLGTDVELDGGLIPQTVGAPSGPAIFNPVMGVLESPRSGLYETPTVQINSGGGKPGQGYAAIREGSSVRRLTPLECERLQGFPDNWTAGQSDTQRYRQMGNAVAVPVAEWIGHRLAAT